MSQTTLQMPLTGVVSGLAFATALNTHLAALASKSSGTTAPTTTFPFMDWLDTSADPAVWKIRNAANDAWINIATLSAAGVFVPVIGTGGISTTMLADEAVTSGKIGAGAVTSGKIGDGAVATAKLADGAVTGAKMEASGVAANTYATPSSVTVDDKGRVTAIAAGAPAGGDLVLLGTVNVGSGSSATITGLAASKALLLVLREVQPNTGSASVRVDLSSTNGSAYGASRQITPSGAAGTARFAGEVNILNAGVAGNKTISPIVQDYNSDGGIYLRNSSETSITGVINALRFTPSTGNFSGSGTIEVYGLK